jgi:predicted nucleotidyltransferase
MDNKLKIINYLGKNLDRTFTMNELSKATGIPYATFYRTLQAMKDLLVTEKVGKATTVRLSVIKPIIQSYLAIASEEEKKEFIKKQHIIRIIQNEIKKPDVVLLFGSYAKGEESPRSDIDLMVINKNGQKTASFSKYEVLHNKEINPVYFTEQEFKQMLREKSENVGKQALKGHVVLNNPKRFWELALDALQQRELQKSIR